MLKVALCEVDHCTWNYLRYSRTRRVAFKHSMTDILTEGTSGHWQRVSWRLSFHKCLPPPPPPFYTNWQLRERPGAAEKNQPCWAWILDLQTWAFWGHEHLLSPPSTLWKSDLTALGNERKQGKVRCKVTGDVPTCQCRIILHSKPSVSLGFPSTMSVPPIFTSSTCQDKTAKQINSRDGVSMELQTSWLTPLVRQHEWGWNFHC